jgi:hypothetical protein
VLGERLFALVALAHRDGLDPEQALRDANARFIDFDLEPGERRCPDVTRSG